MVLEKVTPAPGTGRAGPRDSSVWTSTRGRAPSTGSVVRATVLVIGALVVLAPIIWAVLSSFKTPTELAARPPSIVPRNPTTANYTDALTSFDFTTYFLNSTIVTVVATVLTLAVNSTAAYALAKYNFRGRDTLFLITLATIMIPLQVIFLPVFQVVSSGARSSAPKSEKCTRRSRACSRKSASSWGKK